MTTIRSIDDLYKLKGDYSLMSNDEINSLIEYEKKIIEEETKIKVSKELYEKYIQQMVDISKSNYEKSKRIFYDVCNKNNKYDEV